MNTKVLCALIALSSSCMADEKHTLAGIKEVSVLVESVSGAGVPGLSDDTIQTDVESYLRMFGMKLGTDPPIILEIRCDAVPGRGFAAQVGIWQMVELGRDPSIRINHRTWWSEEVTEANLNAQTVRDVVKKQMSELLVAWLDENPDG